MDKTLVLIKPDGVKRQLVGTVISRIEAKGYVIDKLAMVTPTLVQLRSHYEEHTDKPFFEPLLKFMSSGPIVAMEVHGNRVVEGFRSLAGETNPTIANPGTIRGDYGREWGSGVVENIVHGSDSTLSAERELQIWFPSDQKK